jgi:hypothetical protein
MTRSDDRISQAIRMQPAKLGGDIVRIDAGGEVCGDIARDGSGTV